MTIFHGHHVDGRSGPGLPYVDASLTIDLTPPDHAMLHLLLEDLGAQWPREGEPMMLHRARRHAVTFGAAADAGRSVTFAGAAIRAEHRLWLDVLAALELGKDF